MKYEKIFLVFTITAAIAQFAVAAVIPDPDGNISSAGFTRMDFCQYDQSLYAFNGLDLYRYDTAEDSFVIIYPSLGTTTSLSFDPADFAFETDSNNILLPTGLSRSFVYADIQNQQAQEITDLNRNYYSIASRFRFPFVAANGITSGMNNTIYSIGIDETEKEKQLAEISNANSGAIAFDFADNLYISDFIPLNDGSGLGNVDIYRIPVAQIDSFIDDNNDQPVPELIADNIILAGSDSIVIDANYNIYITSYVGIAKVIVTNDPAVFTVEQIDGNIYANPHQGWPMLSPVFNGITADIVSGKLYYGRSEVENFLYLPYQLNTADITPATVFSADLDGDGIVSFEDLLILVQDFNYQGDYLKGDIKTDGKVDMIDFAAFSGQWNKKAPWYNE
jgi:hypothetical protein